jgi:multicomponent Na+:H+ antiporter subunit D
MMLLVWPILLPMLTAVAGVVIRTGPRRTHWVALAGAVLHLAAAIVLLAVVIERHYLVARMGSWPAPFGIVLVADYLSAVMVLIAAVIHTAVTVYSRPDIDALAARAAYYPFMQILTAAVCGAFLTGDLFNLYVWFEVMLMASFGLLVMGRRRSQLTGAVKYVTLNLVSALLFLTAVGLLYGLTGTLNMADLHLKVPQVENGALLTATAMLLIAAFGIKAALFPLFFWMPAAYPSMPAALAAFFSGLLSKVGVYALIRMFTLVFTTDTGVTHTVLLAVAGFTMLFGVLSAAVQMEMRRILSFHIISQIGYMVLGLALLTPLALAGAIVYMLHNILAKANLFLVSGLVRQAGGSYHLERTGGLYKTHGLAAIGFLISALALAGIPPLSGFWAKLLVIRASLESYQYTLAFVATLVGLLTLFSMVKIWSEVFWKPAPLSPPLTASGGLAETGAKVSAWMLGPVLTLAGMIVLLGLFMDPVIRFADAAALQLLEPSRYVKAVLGGLP